MSYPHCRHCDQICQVPLPLDAPLPAAKAYGQDALLATCTSGQISEQSLTGWCYDTVIAAIQERQGQAIQEARSLLAIVNEMLALENQEPEAVPEYGYLCWRAEELNQLIVFLSRPWPEQPRALAHCSECRLGVLNHMCLACQKPVCPLHAEPSVEGGNLCHPCLDKLIVRARIAGYTAAQQQEVKSWEGACALAGEWYFSSRCSGTGDVLSRFYGSAQVKAAILWNYIQGYYAPGLGSLQMLRRAIPASTWWSAFAVPLNPRLLEDVDIAFQAGWEEGADPSLGQLEYQVICCEARLRARRGYGARATLLTAVEWQGAFIDGLLQAVQHAHYEVKRLAS